MTRQGAAVVLIFVTLTVVETRAIPGRIGVRSAAPSAARAHQCNGGGEAHGLRGHEVSKFCRKSVSQHRAALRRIRVRAHA